MNEEHSGLQLRKQKNLSPTNQNFSVHNTVSSNSLIQNTVVSYPLVGADEDNYKPAASAKGSVKAGGYPFNNFGGETFGKKNFHNIFNPLEADISMRSDILDDSRIDLSRQQSSVRFGKPMLMQKQPSNFRRIVADELGKNGNAANSRTPATFTRNQVSFLPSKATNGEEAKPDYFESLAKFEAWRKMQHSSIEQFMFTAPESASVVAERDVLDNNDHYSRLLKMPKGIMMLYDNETMDDENIDASLEALLQSMPASKLEAFKAEVQTLNSRQPELPTLEARPVPILDLSMTPKVPLRPAKFSTEEEPKRAPSRSAFNSSSKGSSLALNNFNKQSSFREMQAPFTTCQNTESKSSYDGVSKQPSQDRLKQSIFKKKKLSIRLGSARKTLRDDNDYGQPRTSSREKKIQKIKVKNAKKQKQHLAQTNHFPVQSVFYPAQPLDYMQTKPIQPVQSTLSSLRKKRSIEPDNLASVESDMRKAIGLTSRTQNSHHLARHEQAVPQVAMPTNSTLFSFRHPDRMERTGKKSSPSLKLKRPVTAKLASAIEPKRLKNQFEMAEPKSKAKKKKQQILKAQALSKARFVGSGLGDFGDPWSFERQRNFDSIPTQSKLSPYTLVGTLQGTNTLNPMQHRMEHFPQDDLSPNLPIYATRGSLLPPTHGRNLTMMATQKIGGYNPRLEDLEASEEAGKRLINIRTENLKRVGSFRATRKAAKQAKPYLNF